MKIVLVGAGKTGIAILDQLEKEKHDITVVDVNEGALVTCGQVYDVMTVVGNAMEIEVLKNAGVPDADLMIATTLSDESNLLICLLAKKLGVNNTIARVRNPDLSEEMNLIKEELGLGMYFNPEYDTAMEIARVLRIPSAMKADTFAKGRLEFLKIQLAADSQLAGKTLMEIGKMNHNVLVCGVERGEDELFIPNGSFRLQAGDRIRILAKPKEIHSFFRKMKITSGKINNIMILGGTRITVYLTRMIQALGGSITIIDPDPEVCESLSEEFPKNVSVILGDFTDHSLLLEEGIENADAVLTLTGYDEENILLSLYASKVSKGKVITKVTRNGFGNIVSSLDLNSVYYPPRIAATEVSRYVRGLQNTMGSDIETMYQIMEGRAEALEFAVHPGSKACHIPIKDLKIRKNILIGSINRRGQIITPRGDDTIEPYDTVVVVTTNTGLSSFDDILER